MRSARHGSTRLGRLRGSLAVVGEQETKQLPRGLAWVWGGMGWHGLAWGGGVVWWKPWKAGLQGRQVQDWLITAGRIHCGGAQSAPVLHNCCALPPKISRPRLISGSPSQRIDLGILQCSSCKYFDL